MLNYSEKSLGPEFVQISDNYYFGLVNVYSCSLNGMWLDLHFKYHLWISKSSEGQLCKTGHTFRPYFKWRLVKE